MPEAPKLTGRRRHRVQERLFRKPVMVLQVEFEGLVSNLAGGQIDCDYQKWWVDCKPEWYFLEFEPGVQKQ